MALVSAVALVSAPIARVHDRDEPVDVEERQHGDVPFRLAHADSGADLAEIRDEVPVGEHHALGQPGGAAGIRQRDDTSGGVDHDLQRPAARLKQRRERRRAGRLAVDEDLLHAGPLCRRGRLVQQRRHRHQQPRATVAASKAATVKGPTWMRARRPAGRPAPATGGPARRPGSGPKPAARPARSRAAAARTPAPPRSEGRAIADRRSR